MVLLFAALFIAAIWPHFKHLSTDWWGILALGGGICLCFLALRLLPSKPQIAPRAVLVEETRQSPVWVGYESEEAWHHAIDYQNRLIDIGRKLDGVLRSVQIDAFKLAKDLREFLDEMGERPDADWTGVSTSEKIAERLQERWRLQAPYESRVANGFQLRFAGRLREVMLRLGEQGADRSVILSPYLDAKNNELDIEQAAKDLENQAITISARRISDPDNDTRVKLERLPADDFKHLFIVDPSFTEWIEKRLGPRPLKKSRTKKSRTDGDDPNCSRCLWHYSNPFALGSFPSVLLSPAVLRIRK
jgi:hypothetical protein